MAVCKIIFEMGYKVLNCWMLFLWFWIIVTVFFVFVKLSNEAKEEKEKQAQQNGTAKQVIINYLSFPVV